MNCVDFTMIAFTIGGESMGQEGSAPFLFMWHLVCFLPNTYCNVTS